MAELVAAVVGRIRLHAVEQRIAAEDLRKLRRCDALFVNAQQRRDFARIREQPRGGDGRGLDRGIQRAVHLPHARAGSRSAGRCARRCCQNAGLASGVLAEKR